MATKTQELRARYSAAGFPRAEAEADPLDQFQRWYAQASDADLVEVDAMLLATVSPSSAPCQRSVLMKGFDQRGFVFFTNHGSRKGRQMRGNHAVSAVFPWYALHRQVIIEGEVSRISEAESEQYFHSRPREAQLGAWASRQSEALASRRALEERVAKTAARFRDQAAPLPPFWGGYRIRPQRMEFWQGRSHRLHDRILYTRQADSSWEISRLSP